TLSLLRVDPSREPTDYRSGSTRRRHPLLVGAARRIVGDSWPSHSAGARCIVSITSRAVAREGVDRAVVERAGPWTAFPPAAGPGDFRARGRPSRRRLGPATSGPWAAFPPATEPADFRAAGTPAFR